MGKGTLSASSCGIRCGRTEEAKVDYLCTSMNRGRPAEVPHRGPRSVASARQIMKQTTVAEERADDGKGASQRTKSDEVRQVMSVANEMLPSLLHALASSAPSRAATG